MLVAYHSVFGNIKLVAEAVAAGLGESGTVHTISLGQLGEVGFDSVDLLVVGCPTHKMNLPQEIRPLLEALPYRSLQCIQTAAFNASYRMSCLLGRFTAAKKLDRTLPKLGGRRILPPVTFTVAGREGPLEFGELERARLWGKNLLEEMAAKE
jgi:flavodoxin